MIVSLGIHHQLVAVAAAGSSSGYFGSILQHSDASQPTIIQ